MLTKCDFDSGLCGWNIEVVTGDNGWDIDGLDERQSFTLEEVETNLQVSYKEPETQPGKLVLPHSNNIMSGCNTLPN